MMVPVISFFKTVIIMTIKHKHVNIHDLTTIKHSLNNVNSFKYITSLINKDGTTIFKGEGSIYKAIDSNLLKVQNITLSNKVKLLSRR